MAISYGKRERGKNPSPSSTRTVAAEVAARPHLDLLPPPDPMIKENERRAEVSNEARSLFHTGLLAHEILDRYQDEAHWMSAKVGEWEVVYRREQLAFLEGQDKPAPKFSAPAVKRNDDYLPMPEIEVDKPHLKAVGVKTTVWRSDTGEAVDELVWIPRKFIKGDQVKKWIVDRKLEELEAKYPIASIDNFPKAA